MLQNRLASICVIHQSIARYLGSSVLKLFSRLRAQNSPGLLDADTQLHVQILVDSTPVAAGVSVGQPPERLWPQGLRMRALRTTGKQRDRGEKALPENSQESWQVDVGDNGGKTSVLDAARGAANAKRMSGEA